MSAAASSIRENWVQPRQKPFTKTREREQFTQLSGDNGSLGLVSWLNQNLIGLNEAWSPFIYEPTLSSSCNEHGRAGRSRAPEGSQFQPSQATFLDLRGHTLVTRASLGPRWVPTLCLAKCWL